MQDLPLRLKARIAELAREFGFQAMGVSDATHAPDFDRFEEWVDRGYAGEMNYLPDRRDAYRHPERVMPSVRSIVLLGMSYKKPQAEEIETRRGLGRIASYATSSHDYHEIIHRRLNSISEIIAQEFPMVRSRGVIDTAPLLERPFARQAGLGWLGKNTLLLNRQLGSYLFLASLLIDIQLPADEAFATDHCGTCTACLTACPTQAFVEPYVMDARKCISYLTIEHRSAIPEELHAAMGDWLFGCDVCQQVCPWNRKTASTQDEALTPDPTLEHVELLDLLRQSPEDFRSRFRSTPMWRPKQRGMLRNAMIVATNQGLVEAIPLLEHWSQVDDVVLRETAQTCLRRFRSVSTSEAPSPIAPSSEM